MFYNECLVLDSTFHAFKKEVVVMPTQCYNKSRAGLPQNLMSVIVNTQQHVCGEGCGYCITCELVHLHSWDIPCWDISYGLMLIDPVIFSCCRYMFQGGVTDQETIRGLQMQRCKDCRLVQAVQALEIMVNNVFTYLHNFLPTICV